MREKFKRFSKILATIGTATETEASLKALFDSGVDMFRLNFSHGTHEEQHSRYKMIRKLAAAEGRHVSIIADLQGPKLRVGKFANNKIILKNGERFRVDLSKELGDQTRVQLPHPEIFKSIRKGTEILLNDGYVKLIVEKVGSDYADTLVAMGGELSNNKGFNIPNAILGMSVLTPKDRKDLDFALGMGVNWIALSFVQTAQDILDAKKIIKGRAGVIAKVEKPSAIDNLEAIVTITDAVMVARGDLGVEVDPASVPVLQRRILECCRRMGKPVIVATQMLESMIQNPVPTRAEASDVATAIYEGADAVMLSAETAAGKYPSAAVAVMDRVIDQVQLDPEYWRVFKEAPLRSGEQTTDAVSAASKVVAEAIGAKAIICLTASGRTVLDVARQRPSIPIVCLTADPFIAEQMGFVWGTSSFLLPKGQKIEMATINALASDAVHKLALAKKGDKVVLTAGHPFGVAGSTNWLRVVTL